MSIEFDRVDPELRESLLALSYKASMLAGLEPNLGAGDSVESIKAAVHTLDSALANWLVKQDGGQR